MTTPQPPSLEAPSLERLEELARAASPGPWEAHYDGDGDWVVRAGLVNPYVVVKAPDNASGVDAEFVAALSPDVALWLIEQVRTMEGNRTRAVIDLLRTSEELTAALVEAASLRSRVQGLEARLEYMSAEHVGPDGGPVINWCPLCGPAPRIDEDGCCAECGCCTGDVPDVRALRSRVQELEAEVAEDAGVIAVWRRRTAEAEAERDAARAALERVTEAIGQVSNSWVRCRLLAALGAETPPPKAPPEQRRTFRDVVEEILDAGNVERATDHLIRFVAACVDYYRDKPVRVMGCEFQPPPKEGPADDGLLHDRLHDTAQLGSRVARSVKNPGKPPPKEEP